jgi:hypothetical protein
MDFGISPVLEKDLFPCGIYGVCGIVIIARRVWSTIAFVLFAVGLGTFGISSRVSAAFGTSGMVALFAYAVSMGINSSEKRWLEAKGLLKLSLVSIVAGSAFFLVGSIAQLFGQSALVVSLFDAIAGTCAIMWIIATILALLVSRPQEQESVQA